MTGSPDIISGVAVLAGRIAELGGEVAEGEQSDGADGLLECPQRGEKRGKALADGNARGRRSGHRLACDAGAHRIQQILAALVQQILGSGFLPPVEGYRQGAHPLQLGAAVSQPSR